LTPAFLSTSYELINLVLTPNGFRYFDHISPLLTSHHSPMAPVSSSFPRLSGNTLDWRDSQSPFAFSLPRDLVILESPPLFFSLVHRPFPQLLDRHCPRCVSEFGDLFVSISAIELNDYFFSIRCSGHSLCPFNAPVRITSVTYLVCCTTCGDGKAGSGRLSLISGANTLMHRQPLIFLTVFAPPM